MTILVGVKCTDGVVIGTDSIATSAAGPMPLVQLQSNEKMRKIGNKGLLAATGSVGLSQRINAIADQMWKDKEFKGTVLEVACAFSGKAIANFGATHLQKHPQLGINFGALLAMVVEDKAELIEFGSTDFQPEVRHGKLFTVSMGSGQTLADPFLAFISRVLWKDQIPDVELAKMGVFWALDHTIKFAPGGVGPPVMLGVLKKTGVDWAAEIWDESASGEQAQFIAELESKIGPDLAMASAAASAPPKLK